MFKILSSLLFDRLPSEEEHCVMIELQNKISTQIKFDIEKHEHLLKQLHSLCDVGEYEAVGPSWKECGFQSGDPISDIRGGGTLCLENLIYFLSTSSNISLNMRRLRSNRALVIVNGDTVVEDYPWAAASISITRLLANQMCLTDPLRGSTLEWNQLKPGGFYHLFLEPNAFNRLYCLVFILFDHEFTRMNASYLSFPMVLKHVTSLVENMLQNPSSVHECAKYVSMRVQGEFQTDIECI